VETTTKETRMNTCTVCALPDSAHDGTEEHRFNESHIPAASILDNITDADMIVTAESVLGSAEYRRQIAAQKAIAATESSRLAAEAARVLAGQEPNLHTGLIVLAAKINESGAALNRIDRKADPARYERAAAWWNGLNEAHDLLTNLREMVLTAPREVAK